MKHLLSLCLLLTLVSPLHAQFTYASLNVPGAVATEVRGININGEVAGFYKTTACNDLDFIVPTCPVKGFKYLNGIFTKLMVPGSSSTAIMGLNDLGDLVGFYGVAPTSSCSVTQFHGFIWYHQNVIRTIDVPGSDLCSAGSGTTVAFGINKAGTVVGGIWGTDMTTGGFPTQGWVWVNGTFSVMNPGQAQAQQNGACCWSVNGIANNGFIDGSDFQNDFFTAWFKDASDEDFFRFAGPNFVNGSDTYGLGVNSNSDMSGWSGAIGGWFVKHIELNENNDAVEVQPQPLTVKFPNSLANGTANSTFPFGMNDLRWLAGRYVDSSGITHGFIAKPNF